MVRRSAALAAAAAAALALLAPAHEVAADPTLAAGQVHLEAEPGVTVSVGDVRYLGTVELTTAADDAPLLVNDLDLESYVLGVAEMPGRWPLEALKAQAVAARTYAWYSAELGSFEGYDLCATTACQVFRGAETVLEEASGSRWRQAVEETAGQVLVDDDGRPILARYFSTSGGRTYANEDVFPSSGPRPYLVAFDDPDDEVSPYHRWTARFTRAEFDEVLSRGETLAATVPVAAVERLGEVDDPGAEVRVTGQDGTVVDVGAVALRDFLSRVAPSAYPDRFPQARADGLRPLPSTVPSGRFDAEVTDDEVVLHGRGWGHGVGMGQYGARGRADRGEDHREILAAYYGGLEPIATDAAPERIRVGRELASSVTLRADGRARLVVGDEVVADPALGTWQVEHDGAGWVLTAPQGHDAPLEVAPTRPATGVRDGPDAVVVETDVNKPVLLHLEVSDQQGTEVARRELGATEAGTHAATWRYEDDAGEIVPAGTYRVALVAEDGQGARAGEPLEVEVPGAAARGVANAAETVGVGAGTLTGMVAVAVAAVAGILVLVGLRRRGPARAGRDPRPRPRRGSPPSPSPHRVPPPEPIHDDRGRTP